MISPLFKSSVTISKQNPGQIRRSAVDDIKLGGAILWQTWRLVVCPSDRLNCWKDRVPTLTEKNEYTRYNTGVTSRAQKGHKAGAKHSRAEFLNEPALFDISRYYQPSSASSAHFSPSFFLFSFFVYLSLSLDFAFTGGSAASINPRRTVCLDGQESNPGRSYTMASERSVNNGSSPIKNSVCALTRCHDARSSAPPCSNPPPHIHTPPGLPALRSFFPSFASLERVSPALLLSAIESCTPFEHVRVDFLPRGVQFSFRTMESI